MDVVYSCIRTHVILVLHALALIRPPPFSLSSPILLFVGLPLFFLGTYQLFYFFLTMPPGSLLPVRAINKGFPLFYLAATQR